MITPVYVRITSSIPDMVIVDSVSVHYIYPAICVILCVRKQNEEVL